jgi:hypothetical protein
LRALIGPRPAGGQGGAPRDLALPMGRMCSPGIVATGGMRREGSARGARPGFSAARDGGARPGLQDVELGPFTSGRMRTRIVNTPRTVPRGAKAQAMAGDDEAIGVSRAARRSRLPARARQAAKREAGQDDGASPSRMNSQPTARCSPPEGSPWIRRQDAGDEQDPHHEVDHREAAEPAAARPART